MPAYIASHHGLGRILATTTRPGWHDASGAFVLPHRIIGKADVWFQDSGKGAHLFTERGSLKSWQGELAHYCRGDPVLILSVCCVLAGPVLSRVGVNAGTCTYWAFDTFEGENRNICVSSHMNLKNSGNTGNTAL
ncbi:DUF927 domain-containing protein [Salinicola peritrichatus]|uniref:DUF927 domain-containing protein n=1 Tax=Salinicola peritrichatus TaxID=1267424 RepID=UPI000DA1673C|nr:DUF927 domain-containing protein [Salinicola peritrichatus]